MIPISDNFYSIRRSKKTLSMVHLPNLSDCNFSHTITIGQDYRFSSAIVLVDREGDRNSNLGLLGYNNCGNYLDCVQLRGVNRFATRKDRQKLFGIRWDEAMLRYLVDIAIEDQVDEVRVIPSKMVLRSGNPRSVDLIQRRYDRTPEELGFVYDEDLSRHRFSINGKVNLGDDSTADCASLSLLDIMLGKIF